MLKIAGRLIVVAILCSAFGLQWLALQSVAWTAMMVQNAKQVSFCQAVKRTFDGAHPCSLCHVVNKGKASERKRESQTSASKLDILCVTRLIQLLPGWSSVQYPIGCVAISETEDLPPVPPPRAQLA